ncbi:MAG: hypothetical protein FD124_1674 [Alphaproteobacteria bacterium]|nr:MAG: hypothetical protein FD124_1674 [Alphaproteobacteria bacterium]
MQIFTPVTRTDLKACAQSLRLWLMEIAVWLVEARRELRQLIFLMMCARMRFRKTERRRRWMRPPSTPAGFRYAHRRIDMVRLYTRRISLRTFARMRRVLDNLDAVVKRAIAGVPKCITTGKLVLTRSGGAPAAVSLSTPPADAKEDRGVGAPDTS